ncbi:hypothetical protein [Paraflavitalea speifideaquila]|uniref:hypothetical protein n=1 Tax=Paraflavitalea speifideaquila TaxID=3076558 RepID=UPI0028EBD386|nr:hypothetical protein [Paraflavitalea speifideiaquila]
MKQFVHLVHGLRMPLPERAAFLTVIIFLTGLFPAHANGNQDLLERRITIQLSKAPLTDAIRQIESASHTSFYFDQKILDGRTDLITLDVKTPPLKKY